MSQTANKLSMVPSQAQATGPVSRKIKKGQFLFSEGENSRAMYFLKTGMIRIFKKKGDSNIEIDTVHSGQIVGELAFLDGNPRSASGEALTDCELMEISGPTFQAVLQQMPDWLKLLLKTVVGRLRTASTRIRQLESASTAYDYSERDGKRSSHYVYLSTHDVLKISVAILLVASRHGKSQEKGIAVRVSQVQRYGNQILGMPVAKITTLVDLLAQIGIMQVTEQGEASQVTLLDPDFLDGMITYLNEENQLEPSKRHDLSVKGFMLMSMLSKHLLKCKKDEATGSATVNLAELRKLESGASGKDAFRLDDFQELVKLGYATQCSMRSAEEILTQIKPETFQQSYRLQRVVMSLNAVNEQKRKGGGTGR